MNYHEPERLRVLIVNECKGRLALIAPIVRALGYEVVASQVDVQGIGAMAAREWPDVALVGLGDSSQHALELIDKIVREATCPVIVLTHARDPDSLQQTSKRGAFAHISQ